MLSPGFLPRRLPVAPGMAVACALAAVLSLVGGRTAHGGGGPENVLLVVNDLDADSKTIANHYIRWRNLPSVNVLNVAWQGSQESCTVERFREELLKPILETINKRRLGAQIDYIVYSAGFPWRVDLKGDFPDEKFRREMRPVASLTGATYLWPYILKKTPAIVTPDTNWYVPETGRANVVRCRSALTTTTRGFRSRYGWTQDRDKVEEPGKGQRYFLSTMLGVTDGRGNSCEEVLDYLQRSIQADRTQPGGTFYFAKNSDIRSKTRDACYAGVIAALKAEGARATIVSGTAPRNASDIIGFTVGAQFSDLAAAGSSVMPGAICEHFTSYGGDLRKDWHQMPLTDFLREGAAGASGTVVEPMSVQAKFPLPTIHLHYLRGCSLAEAFYQSVAGPYQLLIVGDPLCQPWAKPPQLVVAGVEAGQEVAGAIEIQAHLVTESGAPRGPCELFVDGRLIAKFATAKPVRLDTAKIPDGHHELRVVAVGADAIEARDRVVLPITVNNQPDEGLKLTISPLPVAQGNEWVKLTASAPSGAGEVVFAQGGRELGRATLAGERPEATIRVRANRLGTGPVRINAQLVSGPRAAPKWFVVR